MHLGISTACFYPQLTEDALVKCARAGACRAEVFVNARQEFTEAFFKRLGDIAHEWGIRIVSIHPYTSGFETTNLFSGYARRFEDGLEEYRRYFALAAQVGAEYFILHGPLREAPICDGEVFSRFSLLQRAARAYGVTLLQENVERCKSGSPGFIRRMREAVGSDGAFVLDTKQARRAGFTARQMMDAMGSGIRHVHISDYDGDRDCLAPGQGVFDNFTFAQSLRALRFSGTIMIELYRDSYKNDAKIVESYKYLQNILAI